jgi:hypothetical protein
VWRRGIDVDRALAVYEMVVSPWAFDVAVTERGWAPADVEELWAGALAELLLA